MKSIYLALIALLASTNLLAATEVKCGGLNFKIFDANHTLELFHFEALRPLTITEGIYGTDHDSDPEQINIVYFDQDSMYSETYITFYFPDKPAELEEKKSFRLKIDFSDSEGMTTEFSEPWSLDCKISRTL